MGCRSEGCKPGAREHAFPNRGGLTDCFHEKVEITATVLPLFGVQRIMALLNRGSTVSYYHLDGNGSVRALSNSSKTITDTYSYNAFGELISSTGSTVNPFRWLGGAGIYDDGARGSVFGLINGFDSMFLPTATVAVNFGKDIISSVGIAGVGGGPNKGKPCADLKSVEGACIAYLCGLKTAVDMAKGIKGLPAATLKELAKAFGKVLKGAKMSPDDCCRAATSNPRFGTIAWMINGICNSRWWMGRAPANKLCSIIHGWDDPNDPGNQPCHDCCVTMLPDDSSQDRHQCNAHCGG